MSHHAAEERIWLVDENDQPVGEGWQLRDHDKNWQNFRVVNVFVRNKEGKLWLPRRAKNKRSFPDCLDMSMGGHVDWPESYEQAYERELMEELNLDAKLVKATYLGHIGPKQIPSLSAFMKVYEIEMDESPDYNPGDFTGAEWLSPDEFRQRVKDGEKTKGDLPALIDHFYPSKN
jgi:isopentenyldiphosphate isomerase